MPCVFAHAEKEFGIAPHLTINAVFEKGDDNTDLKLCFNDRMFNNGMIKFSFSKDELKDLPELSQE